jgi:hypothetical protein
LGTSIVREREENSGSNRPANVPSKNRWMQPQSMNHIAVRSLPLLIPGCTEWARTEVVVKTKPTAPAKAASRIGTGMLLGWYPGRSRSGGK